MVPGPVSTRQPEPERPRVEPEQGLRELLAAQYRALSTLDAEAFAEPWAEDAFVLGPLSEDVHTGRAAALPAVRRQFQDASGDSLRVESLGLRVRVVAGARCAWAFDQLRVVDGQHSSRMHVTAIAEETDDGYRVVAQSWTYPLPNIVAWARAGQGGLPVPSPIAEHVDQAARPVREAVRRWAERRDFGTFSGRQDTLLVGTSTEDVFEGDEAIREELQGLIDDPDVTLSVGPGVLARAACGGRMAYVAFNQTFLVGHTRMPIPTRALAFYEREADGFRPVLLFTALADVP